MSLEFIIEMFTSLIVLSKDLGSTLLRKSLSQNTKGAESVIQALRDRKESNPEDETTIVTSQTGNECGIFLEVNDVIVLAVVEEEVNKTQTDRTGAGLPTALLDRRCNQNRDRRAKGDQDQGEDDLAFCGRLAAERRCWTTCMMEALCSPTINRL